MGDNFFVDTNIFVYSVADDLDKRAIAEELLMHESLPTNRQFGQFKGKIDIREDFDDALPDTFWSGDEP